jgi:hypothetical protein
MHTLTFHKRLTSRIGEAEMDSEEQAHLIETMKNELRRKEKRTQRLEKEMELLEEFIIHAGAICPGVYSDFGFREWLKEKGLDEHFKNYKDGNSVRLEVWCYLGRELKRKRAALIK